MLTTHKNQEEKNFRIFPRRGLLWEARTRILLWYIALMLSFIGFCVPITFHLVFNLVNTRVQEDLFEELENFREFVQEFTTEGQKSLTQKELPNLFQEFLERTIPEDDTFLITILEGRFYDSTPRALPLSIQKHSALMKSWRNLSEKTQGKENTSDSTTGNILYLAEPILIDGTVKGVFIAAHLTRGEQQEALDVIFLVSQILIGGVLIATIIAWLVSGQVLIPLKTLATTVRTIGETNLDRRISIRGTGEIAELGKIFNQMMDRLQETFENQRQFLNNVGHELRTPITIIGGHLELMGDDPEEQRETLALVMDELERMGRLVEDLILLAKSERPDFLQRETIDIAYFTEELYNKLRGLAPRQWLLENQAQGNLMGGSEALQASADRQRITQAMMNLVQNSIQHTTPEDRITIGSELVDNSIRFWVSDTGEGIEPKDQQRIFERFARGSNHRRRSEGSGLGLSIVKAIAEAHGGWVELVSELGVGSTFSLILPLVSD